MSHPLDTDRAINSFFASFNNTATSKKGEHEPQEKVNSNVGVQNNSRPARVDNHAVIASDEGLAVNKPVEKIATPIHDTAISPTIPEAPAALPTKTTLTYPPTNLIQTRAATRGVQKPELKATTSKPSSSGKGDRANYLYSPNKLDDDEMPPRMTSVQIEILEQLRQSTARHGSYQNDVVAKFKAAAEVAERLGAAQVPPTEEEDHSLPENVPEKTYEKALEESQEEVREKDDVPSHEDDPVEESSLSYQETTLDSEALHAYPGENVPYSPALTVSPATSPLAAPVDKTQSPRQIPEDIVIIKQESDGLTVPGPQVLDRNDLTRETETVPSKIAEMSLDQEEDVKTHDHVRLGDQADTEDRKHARIFKSWGVPAARDKPASQVRKVVLSNLPLRADFNLIQSLVHGGAIEDMVLSSSGTTSQVLFTTADACDNYYNTYPNGLVFRLKGKSHTIFVDKGKDVDVISGMLEGYLGAGATRVVQASDADEDWSMRALSRIAEGKKGQRKVESILDSFRDEVRTITFRFTSIVDAVAFRGMLLRDPEWEGCSVQFVADPCEKAVGVHFD